MVDEQDNAIGSMEKLEAHQKGALHRAISVLLFNSRGELLLQKRAKSKYHSGSLWTNTCCSHPLPEETTINAAQRKLKQEMGIDLALRYLFKFQYRAALDNNLIEHEIDHVFVGTFNGEPQLNPDEAEDWKFISREKLDEEILKMPDHYTIWFKRLLSHPEFNFSI